MIVPAAICSRQPHTLALLFFSRTPNRSATGWQIGCPPGSANVCARSAVVSTVVNYASSYREGLNAHVYIRACVLASPARRIIRGLDVVGLVVNGRAQRARFVES